VCYFVTAVALGTFQGGFNLEHRTTKFLFRAGFSSQLEGLENFNARLKLHLIELISTQTTLKKHD